MSKVATRNRTRNRSTAEAARVTPHGTPGDEHGSSRGLSGRSYLSVDHLEGHWCVVRLSPIGALPIPNVETLEVCDDLADAVRCLADWCVGLELPCADFRTTETFDPAGEPGWHS